MAESDRDKWNSLPPFPKTLLDRVTLDISRPNYASYATPLLLVFFHHVTLAPNVATKKFRSEFECVDIIDVRATSIDNEIPLLLFIVMPTRDTDVNERSAKRSYGSIANSLTRTNRK